MGRRQPARAVRFRLRGGVPPGPCGAAGRRRRGPGRCRAPAAAGRRRRRRPAPPGGCPLGVLDRLGWGVTSTRMGCRIGSDGARDRLGWGAGKVEGRVIGRRTPRQEARGGPSTPPRDGWTSSREKRSQGEPPKHTADRHGDAFKFPPLAVPVRSILPSSPPPAPALADRAPRPTPPASGGVGAERGGRIKREGGRVETGRASAASGDGGKGSPPETAESRLLPGPHPPAPASPRGAARGPRRRRIWFMLIVKPRWILSSRGRF